MSRVRSLITVPAAAALAATVLFGGGFTASAADVSTITVHHRLCPTDQTITDYFTDCHDNLVGQSFDFTVDYDGGSETLTTGAATSDGSVDVPVGEVEIYGGVPGEFAETFVYCSQDQVGIDLVSTDKGVSFDAPAGEVVCDWFNTPVDLSGGDNGNDDDDDEGPVTSLPNTGSGPVGGTTDTTLFALLAGLGTIGAATVLRRRTA
jgi:hypothetical protein